MTLKRKAPNQYPLRYLGRIGTAGHHEPEGKFLASLKDRWHKACDETIGTDLFWRIAVDHLSARDDVGQLVDLYAKGVVLDAGAGRLAWRSRLKSLASTYYATDYTAGHSDLDFCADLQGGLPLVDASIDTIFCCSVMEHTPEPWRVLPEFERVLQPGGHVILSVPFVYYLHGGPEDYFRFTRYGAQRLAEQAGFTVIRVDGGGGLALTICQAVSMIATALLWTPRASWLSTCPAAVLYRVGRWIDSLDKAGLFAQNINLVLHKLED